MKYNIKKKKESRNRTEEKWEKETLVWYVLNVQLRDKRPQYR